MTYRSPGLQQNLTFSVGSGIFPGKTTFDISSNYGNYYNNIRRLDPNAEFSMIMTYPESYQIIVDNSVSNSVKNILKSFDYSEIVNSDYYQDLPLPPLDFDTKPPFISQLSKNPFPSPLRNFPSPKFQPTYHQPRSQPTYVQPTYPQPRYQPTYPQPRSSPTYVQPTYPQPRSSPTYVQPTYPQPRTQPTYPQPKTQPMYPQPKTQPTYPQPRTQPTYPQPRTQPTYPQPRTQPTYVQPRSEPIPEPTDFDIDTISKDIEDMFKRLGVPKEDKYTHLKNVDKIINGRLHHLEIRVYRRNYEIEDLDLLDKCFPTRASFLSDSQIYVLLDNDKTIAINALYSGYYESVPEHLWDRNSTSFYLYNVCTDPDFRGHHLQELLLQTAFDHLKTQNKTPINIYLLVLKNNPGAIRLYQRLGFNTIGTTTSRGDEFFVQRLII